MDPGSLDDPIALKTEWSPAAPRSGASFRTVRLVEIEPHRLEFRATGGTWAVTIFLALSGTVGLGLAAWYFLNEREITGLFVLICACAVLALPIWAWRTLIRHRVFDRRAGMYWVGRQPDGIAAAMPDTACKLSQIHAVQLLDELIVDKTNRRTTSYTSFELNLVLKDGRRIPVVDHGNAVRLHEDAARLARFLGCKIWDAAGTKYYGPGNTPSAIAGSTTAPNEPLRGLRAVMRVHPRAMTISLVLGGCWLAAILGMAALSIWQDAPRVAAPRPTSAVQPNLAPAPPQQSARPVTAAATAPIAQAPAPPVEPPVGGPGAPIISGVDRAFLGEPITLRGKHFGRGGTPAVHIGYGDFFVPARIVGFYANDAVTVEIPQELWIPDEEGRYFAQVETQNPPARSHRFPFTMKRNPCAGVAPKDADACAQAKDNQGPCAGKSAAEMPRCLAAQPDPKWEAECAARPSTRERNQCNAEAQAFRECIRIRDVAEADACFAKVVERELVRSSAR